MRRHSLKDQMVEISRDYLGPAAERFIDRQINTHLKKSPNQITKADLKELIDWLRLSFSVLTDDRDLVDEYVSRIEVIGTSNRP